MSETTTHALEVAREILSCVELRATDEEIKSGRRECSLCRGRADLQAKLDAANRVINTYCRTFDAIEGLLGGPSEEYIVDRVRDALAAARREAIEECEEILGNYVDYETRSDGSTGMNSAAWALDEIRSLLARDESGVKP